MHHMPHTGDLPNTVFSTAHSAMTIEPFNYLVGDPSQASSQQVLIKTKKDGKAEIVTYGAKNATCPIDLVCTVSSLYLYNANMPITVTAEP
jgi:primary-amine oxidase